MQCHVEVTFRDIKHSDVLEKEVIEKVEKLSQFFHGILSCQVVIETPHRHHQKGNLFHVRINLKVPDGELVVNRAPGDNEFHADAYVAIRDAFLAMRRQLEAYAQKHRDFTAVNLKRNE